MKKSVFVIALAFTFTLATAQTTPQKNKGHKTQGSDPRAQQKMDAASGGSMHSGGKHTDTGRGESGSDSTAQSNGKSSGAGSTNTKQGQPK